MNYISTYALKEIRNLDGCKMYIPSSCYLIRTIQSEKRKGYQVVFKLITYVDDDRTTKCYIKNFDNFDDIKDVISVDKIYDNYEEALEDAKEKNQQEWQELYNNNGLDSATFNYFLAVEECYSTTSKLVRKQG